MFGNSRTKCGLNIELKDSAANEEIWEGIWELVVNDNENSRIPARIERDMIRLESLTKPFVRAGRGTVVRSLTLKDYEEEIEVMYRSAP